MNNLILNTDSYKPSHWLQYPPNTKGVFDYVEARGPFGKSVINVGLQMYIKEYLTKRITMSDIKEAGNVLKAHGVPFNREGWVRILQKYNGYMPVRIKQAPEGLRIPVSNAVVTVESTDPDFFWLPSYLETSILRAIWYPSTVATISKNIKDLILRYLKETGDPASIDFKLHDFGARGVSSMESAALGGVGHLVNFMGTDTLSAIIAAKKYYNEDMAGFSIPASEHSTITTWGGKQGESTAMENMLNQFAGKYPLVACVSDSYNIYDAVKDIWAGILKEKVINSGSTLVIRPDSGDPVTVIIKVLQILENSFGVSINDKGYKVLPPYVRIIQGDGIDYITIEKILSAMKEKQYSADNIAFGMGGALLQKINRDTYQYAMKTSSININGVWEDVYKDPITKDNTLDKVSKKGRLILCRNENGNYYTDREENGNKSILETVFENGEIVKEYTFSEVRKNSNL